MNILKSKTFYAGVGSIFTGIAFIFQGEQASGINMIITGAISIFLRDAIRKN